MFISGGIWCSRQAIATVGLRVPPHPVADPQGRCRDHLIDTTPGAYPDGIEAVITFLEDSK